MVEQVEIMKQEGGNGIIVRHRAILFAPDSAGIIFEFKNEDTGMWEVLKRKFIDREEFEALNVLFKNRMWGLNVCEWYFKWSEVWSHIW